MIMIAHRHLWMQVGNFFIIFIRSVRLHLLSRLPDRGKKENSPRKGVKNHDANVKHFFTSLGNEFFTSYGKQFFTLYGKKIFTLYGKQFFTLPGREFFTSLSGSRLCRQVLCQLKTSGCLSR